MYCALLDVFIISFFTRVRDGYISDLVSKWEIVLECEKVFELVVFHKSPQKSITMVTYRRHLWVGKITPAIHHSLHACWYMSWTLFRGFLPRPRRGLRGSVFTRSVCLCVCLSDRRTDSVSGRYFGILFIGYQKTFIGQRSRSQGRYIVFWRYSHITKTGP